MTLSIIAAVSENNIIGGDNNLLWHLPADLKRFKQITSEHHIIMGRKTYESVGKPLPDRTNIIVTTDETYKAEGCIVFNTIKEAIDYAKGQDEVFILGGGNIYKQTINIADKMYITRIHENFKGDTYFPVIDKSIWYEELVEAHQPDEKNKYSYTFVNYIRKLKSFNMKNLTRNKLWN